MIHHLKEHHSNGLILDGVSPQRNPDPDLDKVCARQIQISPVGPTLTVM
jgi:hypothetical protein